MRANIASLMLAASMAFGAAACSPASSGLPYKPEVQPAGATISAAFTVVADRLRVEIDSGGRRLERAQIVMSDGSVLEAQTIEYTVAPYSGGSPVGLSFGIGGFSGGGGSAVGTGVGVSTGGVVGGGGYSEIGSTIASFPLAQAGPAPWRVRVTLQGIEPADIVVGGPVPAPR
ncbi:MAG TPA: hypothetical protein VKH83_01570 [Methylomirabilota bacterium]|nr:hypothetical protein [Methylomirabilota bacterium]